MANLATLSLCLLSVFCSVYLVNGVLETVPENSVGMVDSTVTLRCTAAETPLARVLWTEFVTNPLGRVVSDNRGILPSHPNALRYEITGSGNEFNLQISGLSLDDAGKYLCGDINSNPPEQHQGFAELVVLESDPECTPLPTITGVLVEDRFYIKECEVRYRGFFAPNMTWTGPGTFNVDNSVTTTEAWSRVSFTAYREIEGGQFVCTTRFVEPSEAFPPDSATNVPDYLNVFNGNILIINWGPKEMTIIPRKPSYEVGDVLKCEADGKPEPRFLWSNLRTQVIEPEGPFFTVTDDLIGTEQTMRCNANVLIEGSLYTADSFVNMSVPAATTPTTTPTTSVPTTPPADAPCTDLTGQWASTNPNALLCLEVDTRGNILSLIRNGTDAFFVTGHGKTVYNDYDHVGFSGIWPAGSDFGVGGFTGECHRCHGTEVLFMSGLARNKDHSPLCGQSAGTRLTLLYVFTRSGPPCRGLKDKVYRPTEEHIRAMGIPKENIIT